MKELNKFSNNVTLWFGYDFTELLIFQHLRSVFGCVYV